MNGHDVLINPFHLLVVQYDDPVHAQIELAVIGCRYVPMMAQTGPSRVALEIMFDQEEQRPQEPYYCPRGRLVRQLLAPPRVTLIRPYMSFPPSEHLGFVRDLHGAYYGQHFYGENEGAAVITGPSPLGGTQMLPVPEVFRVPAVNAHEARLKLEHWRRTEGWPV